MLADHVLEEPHGFGGGSITGIARHEYGPGNEGSLRHFVEQLACLSHATGAGVELEEEVEVGEGEGGLGRCMEDWFECCDVVVGSDAGTPVEERGGWRNRGRIGA